MMKPFIIKSDKADNNSRRAHMLVMLLLLIFLHIQLYYSRCCGLAFGLRPLSPLITPPPHSVFAVTVNHRATQLLLSSIHSGDNEIIHTKNPPRTPTSPPPPPPSSPRIPLPHGYIANQSRPHFPILSRTLGQVGDDEARRLIYLDSAATSHKPQIVMDAMTEYYQTINANVHRGAHTLSRAATTAYEAARDTVAHFIHAASRNEVVFTSGATEALNLIAYSYGRFFLEAGDEIILTVVEHHANLVPWQLLAQEKNLTIHYTRLNPSTETLDVKHFESLLHPTRTKIVSLQHVSNVLGCIHPIEEMVQRVRSKNAAAKDCIIVLDACQSIPHMPVNVQALGIDFLVASGHKMCGPTGIGFVWGRLPLLNAMPPWKGGGEMIDTVSLTTGTTFLDSPSRFEAGTPPIAEAVGLAAAINYLNNTIGMETIAAYEHELAEYLYNQLSSIPGIRVLGPPSASVSLSNTNTGSSSLERTPPQPQPPPPPHPRVALCAFAHATLHSSDLSTFLDLEGVAVRAGHHCCQPLHQEVLHVSHSCRASLYFYNTQEEIDLFIEKLNRTIDSFSELSSSISTNSFGRTRIGREEDDFVPFV